MPTIEINDQFAAALEAMENTRRPLFITGRAGTGKSTLLTHFRTTTKKEIAVLAPTGVAAVNVQGQTIHSFFKFRPDITLERIASLRPSSDQSKIYKNLDSMVIDEISMVRADLLDCIDAFLRFHGPERGKSFGGVQMILIGDLYQLPPVVNRQDLEHLLQSYQSPYFFDAKCMQELPLKIIELEKIYRQSDDDFINLLGNIRSNTVSSANLQLLNTRYDPHAPLVEPGEEFTIALTTTNELADTVNAEQLRTLASKQLTSQGIVTGTFGERELPTKTSLELRVGAQVMLLNNESRGRWVNGTLGKIKKIDLDGKDGENEGTITLVLSNGTTVDVSPYTWELYRYFFNEKKGQLDTETIGTFRQYPMRLSWAVTIHKAQGKTFDRVVIDIGRGTFSHGQMYVALSRCRTLGGITLRQQIQPRHIYMDRRVGAFFDRFKEAPPLQWLEQDSLFSE
jgi:ATP-dependent DNA helicase PIF1